MFTPNESQVVTYAPDGTDPRYLGQLGHIGALTYSFVIPGGCDQLSCNLMQPPLQRYTAINPGRLVSVYRGASVVWNGKLNEPVPSMTGWALQAYGNGHFGDDFMSYHTNYGVAGDPVAKAIAGTPSPRGKLQWVAPASWPGSVYLQQPPDSGSVTITQYMDDITAPGGLVWYVGRGNQLSVFAPPAVPNRLLVVPEPQARTLAGYFDWMWLRYMSTDQKTSGSGAGAAVYSLTSVDNPAQMARHGVKETYGDLASAGQLTSGAAQAIGTSLLSRYQAANYAGPFSVQPGQLLNLGGTPVDLGCEQAGTVVQLIMTSSGYGGDVAPAPPVQFMVGAFEYDDETITASITPWLGVRSDLASLLSNYTTVHAPKTRQSSWAIKYHP